MDEPQNNQPVVPQEPSQVSPPAPEVPQTPPTPPIMSVATTVGISGKMIAIIIALLVLVGGVGAYFIFFNKTSTPTTSVQVLNTTSPSVSPQPSTSASLGFSCKDIFTDNDFQTSMKESAAGFQFKELSGVNSSGTYLSCYYLQGLVGELLITISKPNQIDAKLAFQGMKSMFISAGAKELSGIGSDAMINQGVALWSLSSNNKYIINTLVTSQNHTQNLEDATKIVDANLNKY